MANMAAAPVPWTARAAISRPAFGASAQQSEETANTIRPIWKVSRRPKRSASEPPSSSSAASDSA